MLHGRAAADHALEDQLLGGGRVHLQNLLAVRHPVAHPCHLDFPGLPPGLSEDATWFSKDATAAGGGCHSDGGRMLPRLPGDATATAGGCHSDGGRMPPGLPEDATVAG